MGGLGIYLWSQIGFPSNSFDFMMMGIGYMSILVLFGLAVKEASNELFLYSYKENGIPILDKTKRVNNRRTD